MVPFRVGVQETFGVLSVQPPRNVFSDPDRALPELGLDITAYPPLGHQVRRSESIRTPLEWVIRGAIQAISMHRWEARMKDQVTKLMGASETLLFGRVPL